MKKAKATVGFEHPAKGRQHCKGCRHFEVEARERCEIVWGKIMPNDWCRKYAPK